MSKVKNKKLLSAIMLGISSMMLLQTPITAYANDPGAEPDNNNEQSQESDQTAENSDGDIVDEALSYDSQTIDDALDQAEDMADAASEAIGAPEDNGTNENAGEGNNETLHEDGAPEADAESPSENSGAENADNLPDAGDQQDSGSSSTDGNEQAGGTDEEQNNSAASGGGDSIILEDTGLAPAVPETTEAASIILEGDIDKNVEALSANAAPDNAVDEIGDLIAAAKEVVEDTEKPVVNGAGNESTNNEGEGGTGNAGEGGASNAGEGGANNAGEGGAGNAGEGGAGNAGEADAGNADNNNDSTGNTTPSTYTDPSAVKSLANSARDVEETKKALEEAEQANEVADESYKDAANAFKEAADCMTDDGAVPGIITSSEIINEIVKEANDEALSFINEIENAENEEQIRQAEEKFRQAKETKKSEYDAQLEWNQLLSEKYQQAVTELEAAQKKLDEAEVRFGEKLGTATDKVEAAQKEVAAAKTKVDNLALALDAADNAIDEAKNNGEYQLTDTKGADWTGKFGVGIDQSRKAMDTVIVNYYLPEVCQLDLVEDDEHKTNIVHKAFSGGNGEYEKNYTEVTYYYKDADGIIQQGTKYFNWDSIAKTDVDHQNLLKKNTVEATTGIVMYEKSEEEVKGTETRAKALAVLSSSITDDNSADYQRNGKSILHKDNIDRCTEQGMLRLYTFVDDNGDEKTITQFELYGKYPALPNVTYKDEGDLTKKMETTVADDGSTLFKAPNGSVYKNLTMVTPAQNQNGLYKDANCLILGDNETISNVLKGEGGYSYVKKNVVDKYSISDGKIQELIDSNKALNDFINGLNENNNNSVRQVNNLKDQLGAYREEVEEAQKAVDNASEKVGAFADAISDIEENYGRFKRDRIAVNVLGIDDVAVHFGLEVDEEKAKELNGMTMTELIDELNKLKKEADALKDAAIESYKDVQAREKEAEEKLAEALQKLQTDAASSSEGAGGTSGGTTGGSAGGTSGGTTGGIAGGTSGGTTAGGTSGGTTAGGSGANGAIVQNTITPTTGTGGSSQTAPASNTGAGSANATTPSANGTAPQAADTAVAATGDTAVAATGEAAPAAADAATAAVADAGDPGGTDLAAAGDVGAADTDGATDVTSDAVAAANADAVADGTAIAASAGPAAADGQGAFGAQAQTEGQAVLGARSDRNGQTVQGARSDRNGQAVLGATRSPLDAQALQNGNMQYGTVVFADIPEEGVALSNGSDLNKIKGDKTATPKNPTVNTVDDNAVLLNNIKTAEDAQKISWWWLLIIFLLGATGKKLYDEHMKRKEEKDKDQ